MNPYETLGVAPDASPEEIKRAYRRLVLEYHPDRVPEHLTELRRDAEEKFKTIVDAFRMLSDAGSRRKFDAQDRTEQRRRAQDDEAARKRAQEEIYRQGLERMQEAAAARLREQRLRALTRKKRVLIALGILACLAPFTPFLIEGARWTQRNAQLLWWRVTSAETPADSWFVESLRLYPLGRVERAEAPAASATLRGYIKGLSGCFVSPARGEVLSATASHAKVRVEFQRLEKWTMEQSFSGKCTRSFVPIVVHLEGQTDDWTSLDILAVDLDTGLERLFASPQVAGFGIQTQ